MPLSAWPSRSVHGCLKTNTLMTNKPLGATARRTWLDFEKPGMSAAVRDADPMSGRGRLAARAGGSGVLRQEEGLGAIRHLARSEPNDPIWRADHPDVHVVALRRIERMGNHDPLRL